MRLESRSSDSQPADIARLLTMYRLTLSPLAPSRNLLGGLLLKSQAKQRDWSMRDTYRIQRIGPLTL